MIGMESHTRDLGMNSHSFLLTVKRGILDFFHPRKIVSNVVFESPLKHTDNQMYQINIGL